MPDTNELQKYLACPRCDNAPLTCVDEQYRCDACEIDFPAIDGMPWMFADPDANLGEWRNRLQLSLQQLSHEISRLDANLQNKDLHSLTRRRLERHKSATEYHRRSLQSILQPIDVQSMSGNYETYMALRTRLPPDQGLNAYYSNVHRDWCWGDEENEASLGQVCAVLKGNTKLGKTVVVGAGAGRLAYDLHMQTDTETTIALDFNPLLLLIAKSIVYGEQLKLYEFPIAPKSLEDVAVLRLLSAPEVVRPGFHFVLGDMLRPPFVEGCFDTVVTPWIIDVVSEDLLKFAARINRLLRPGGRWINFGSLAFDHPQHSRRYSPEEAAAIIAENGFSTPYIAQATIPYMCSPASRHGRQEKVFSFSAVKERDVQAPEQHRALPDWIVTGKESVPLSHSFRTQAMTTQIYSFIMSLIDGKRSIDDMSAILEKQQLMTHDEAVPAIRSFLTQMYDESQ